MAWRSRVRRVDVTRGNAGIAHVLLLPAPPVGEVLPLLSVARGRPIAAQGRVPDTLVTGAADHETRGDCGSGLDPEACPHRSSATEERAERARHRHEGQCLQRAALGALPPGERRALSALTQVRAKLSPLLARQTSIELS